MERKRRTIKLCCNTSKITQPTKMHTHEPHMYKRNTEPKSPNYISGHPIQVLNPQIGKTKKKELITKWYKEWKDNTNSTYRGITNQMCTTFAIAVITSVGLFVYSITHQALVEGQAATNLYSIWLVGTLSIDTVKNKKHTYTSKLRITLSKMKYRLNESAASTQLESWNLPLGFLFFHPWKINFKLTFSDLRIHKNPATWTIRQQLTNAA